MAFSKAHTVCLDKVIIVPSHGECRWTQRVVTEVSESLFVI